MAAQDLTELFDFETAFETAAQTILTDAGIVAYISQQNVTKALISTGIGFDLGPAIDELASLDPAAGYPALQPSWPANQAPPQEYFRYTAGLEFSVEVPRDQNQITPAPADGVDQLLAQIRAKIRTAMMRVMFPFNDTNLPLYRVTDIRPNGTTTGFEAVRNIDFVSLRFSLTFQIKPSAWPAWTS